MNTHKKILFITLVSIITVITTACSTNSKTTLDFSFQTSTLADSMDSKPIYINEDMASLTLSSVLKIDQGSATIIVTNSKTKTEVFHEEFTKNTSFKIKLQNLKATDEYDISISATQAKKVKLTVKSPVKLVYSEEKPEKNAK